MAKITTINKPKYVITLSEEEAITLKQILQNVQGRYNSGENSIAEFIFNNLPVTEQLTGYE